MKINKYIVLSLLIIAGYLISHFWNLTGLPIFSDEAIYIRWAQLIIDDPGRYLFFSLNDGKTPLFVWMLAPFQIFFTDKLLAGRVVSVLIGLAQLFVVKYIIKIRGGSLAAQNFGMILFTILPFWYFHHRIALMDGALVLFISLAVYFSDRTAELLKSKRKLSFKNIAATSIFLAASLLTKIPAVLAFPAIAIVFISHGSNKKPLNKALALKTVLIIFGLAFLLILPLLLVPALPQLFSRGSDFLMPLESFLKGGYKSSIGNIPNYILYFSRYLSPYLLIIMIAGLFKNPRQKIVHQYFWSGIIFSLPIMLLGLVVYSRYFLPAAFFFSIAAIFATEGLALRILPLSKSKNRNKTAIGLLSLSILGIMIANVISTGIQFVSLSISDPNLTPLLSSDREQYLEKWSSGHGVKAIHETLLSLSESKRITVATEGYFGTLPDGLLVYMHGQKNENISVDGIGQPVSYIPDDILTKAQESDQLLLVVNSDRLLMGIPSEYLINEYCRPNNAPCLQLWDLTSYSL